MCLRTTGLATHSSEAARSAPTLVPERPVLISGLLLVPRPGSSTLRKQPSLQLSAPVDETIGNSC